VLQPAWIAAGEDDGLPAWVNRTMDRGAGTWARLEQNWKASDRGDIDAGHAS
jgi:hypothetical protein